MTTCSRFAQKTIATVLATFIFSLPLASIASADKRHDPPQPPRLEDRHDRRPEKKDPPKPPKEEPRRDRDDKRHDRRPEKKDPPKPPKEEPRRDRDDKRHDNPPPRHDRDDHDKDDNGNAVTGFIIGAAVGAIVAKNT